MSSSQSLPPAVRNHVEKPAVTVARRKKILISSNSAWNLVNFRKPVIEALVAAGHDVIAAAPADGHEGALIALGAAFRPLPISAAGTSAVEDFRLLLSYRKLNRLERPDFFLGFTAKPNIYGSLAARVAGIPAIATISGLGSAFLGGGVLGGVLMGLYRLALGGARAIMFQNPADRALFLDRRLARPEQARLVPGSGIDLARFAPAAAAQHDDFTFLLIARLLLDKGIGEFVEAARLLRPRHPRARFQLLGAGGGNNPSAVPEVDLARWARESNVELLGSRDDVRPFIAAADCIVLPSYREGLPRSLLEGAAMTRPLIATDVPGCRDVVDDGVNGLLCDVRSAASLARAMERMMAMTTDDRAAMGAAGRRKVEAQFDQHMVANAYLAELAR